MSNLSELKFIYNKISKKYYNTRKKHWNEFEHIFLEVENYKKKWKIKILDLWCWWARVCLNLNEKKFDNFDYVWVDISKDLLNLWSKDCKWHSFFEDDMKKFLLNIEQESFDIVIMSSSFQHIDSLEDRKIILEQSYRVLKYGWKLIMINWSFSERFIKKYIFEIFKSVLMFFVTFGTRKINDLNISWKLDWKKYDRFYHIFFLYELKKLFSDASFIVKKICYLNRKWKLDVWRNSTSSFIVWEKEIFV